MENPVADDLLSHWRYPSALVQHAKSNADCMKLLEHFEALHLTQLALPNTAAVYLSPYLSSCSWPSLIAVSLFYACFLPYSLQAQQTVIHVPIRTLSLDWGCRWGASWCHLHSVPASPHPGFFGFTHCDSKHYRDFYFSFLSLTSALLSTEDAQRWVCAVLRFSFLIRSLFSAQLNIASGAELRQVQVQSRVSPAGAGSLGRGLRSLSRPGLQPGRGGGR